MKKFLSALLSLTMLLALSLPAAALDQTAVDFTTNGGSACNSQTATYSFNGWKNGTNTYSNGAKVTNLANTNGATVTLTAEWTGGTITLPSTSRQGYIFDGWYTNASFTGTKYDAGSTYTATAKTTFYAKWTAVTYDVVYNGNGNTSGSTANSTHTYDQEKALTGNGFKKEYTVTYNYKDGRENTSAVGTYTFSGWATSENGAKEYDNNQKVTNLRDTAGTYNLYAVWSNESAKVTNKASRIGYTFEGWYTNEECAGNRVDTDGSYIPSSDITLYAKWRINQYAYTVRYLEKETNKVLSQEKTDSTKDYGTVISGETEVITITGYKKVSTNDITISENAGNNIITVYYEIDNDQRRDISYTVEYYQEGKLVAGDTQTETQSVQVLEEDILTVNKSEINTSNKYHGYRLEKTEPAEIPDSIEAGSTIKVYYVIDDTNTKTLNYTVKYYQDGKEVEKDSKTVSQTVQVLQPDTLTVQPVDTANDKYFGYKFEKTEPATLPTSIEDGGLIKVHYITDEAQTKELSYTVEYYKNGEIVAGDTQTEKTIVQVLKDDVLKVAKEKINLTNKYVTYKLERTEPAEIPEEIATGSTIKVFYVTNEEKTGYKIEYYYDNEIDNSKTEEVEIDKGTTVEKAEVEGKAEANKKEGYKLLTIVNVPLKATDSLAANTIKVFYISEKITPDPTPEEPNPTPIPNEKVAYSIEYYYNNEIDSTKTEIVEAEIGKTVNKAEVEAKATANVKEGFELLAIINSPLKVTANVENNVIKIFYKSTTITTPENPTPVPNTKVGYRIEYYYDNQIDNTRSEMVNVEVGTVISKADIEAKAEENKKSGYNLLTIINSPLTVSASIDNNVIKVYYLKDNGSPENPVDPELIDKTGYRIEYYYENEIDNSKSEMIDSKIGNTVSKEEVTAKAEENKKDGYKLLTIVNVPLKVSAKVENNTIKVYYIKEVTEGPTPVPNTKVGYRIEYYYDNEINNEKTELVEVEKGTVVLKADIEAKAEVNRPEEYRLLTIVNAPLTAGEKIENNVIKVYYVSKVIVNPDKPEEPIVNTKVGYRIEYYYDDKINNEKTEIIDAEIGNTVLKSEIDKKVEANKEKGFKLLALINAPLKITENVENNVIKVYYISEEITPDPTPENPTPTPVPNTKVGYRVEYYFDNKIDNSKSELYETEKGTLISKENIEEKAAVKGKEGYKLLTIVNVPLIVTENIENNVIKVFYIPQEITPDPTPENPTPTPVPNTKVGYRIEYYYDEAIDNSKTEMIETDIGTVISKSEIETKAAQNNKEGYELLTIINSPLTVSENVENNAIKVYYKKSMIPGGETNPDPVPNTKVGYRIEYYFDNKIDNSKSELYEVEKGSKISKEEIEAKATNNNKDGYKVLTIANVPLTISENIDNNVIKVFYQKVELTPGGEVVENNKVGYKIEYYYDDEINNEKTEVNEVEKGTVISKEEVNNKAEANLISGYKVLAVINAPLTVGETDNNVIKVYYNKENIEVPGEDPKPNTKVGYRVEYYYENKIDNTKSELIETEIGNIITEKDIGINIVANIKEGYKLLTVVNVPLVASQNIENNVIKVHYIKEEIENPDPENPTPVPNTKVGYRIEYYYDNEIDNEKTEVLQAEKGTIITKEEIKAKADLNIKEKYTYLSMINAPLTVGETDNNVIKVYYKKSTLS